MSSRAHFLLAAAVLALLVVGSHRTTAADDRIGSATAITTAVTGTRTMGTTTLTTGDAVFRNETLTTNATGIGQFELDDQTKLALGPGSTVVLDDFIYKSGTSGGTIAISLATGALRFVTGRADHNAYEIITPTATIGVRGTAFDVYAGNDGELAVALLDGAIEVCPKGGACRLHNVIGRFLHMSAAGIFSLRAAWDGTSLAGVPFGVALPFLADQKNLVPSLRRAPATVGRYVTAVGKDVGKMIRDPLPELPRLPKLKLPKLPGK
jgi:ferric-dicitrate binding protein FerR (iron transport regulator)